MAKKSKKASGIKVDFTGVESSGKHPEGRFAFAVEECEVKTSSSSGNDYLNFKLKSEHGAAYYHASLASHALWNLKNFLEAAGQEVPDGEMEIDPAELVGLEVGAEIVHEKYEGKTRGVVAEIFSIEEVGGEPADDDEEEEESDDEEVTFEAVQDMDLDELLELAGDNDIKVTAKQKKDVDALRDFLCEKLELEEGEEEEDDEEETTYESVQEMDEEDLDALCEEEEIKIPAKKKKKLQAYRDAVCEALDLEESEDDEEEEEEEPKKGKKSKK